MVVVVLFVQGKNTALFVCAEKNKKNKNVLLFLVGKGITGFIGCLFHLV